VHGTVPCIQLMFLDCGGLAQPQAMWVLCRSIYYVRGYAAHARHGSLISATTNRDRLLD